MYGLPENVDLSFLQGSLLLQVCVGANEVQLHFDPEIAICIECGAIVESAAGVALRIDTPLALAEPAFKLINQRIGKVCSRRDGTLTLKFENGYKITITDESDQYESYSIKHQGGYIVV